MAYGVTTHIYLVGEPARPSPAASHAAALWRELRAEERLKVVEQKLRTAA